MARTFNDLVIEVRAQIAVDDQQAYQWLLDRARVLNAEARWLFSTVDLDAATDADGRYYYLPADLVYLEAVLLGGVPYQRSTLHAMDARWVGTTGNTLGIYAQGYRQGVGGGSGLAPQTLLQVHPPSASQATVRYVTDVTDEPDFAPPFPTDFYQPLIDGAVAIGLARMDERMDSAAYFEQRFSNAIERLSRRRHALIGRGATTIRIVQ
jgi:hypothetical protein